MINVILFSINYRCSVVVQQLVQGIGGLNAVRSKQYFVSDFDLGIHDVSAAHVQIKTVGMLESASTDCYTDVTDRLINTVCSININTMLRLYQAHFIPNFQKQVSLSI